MSMKKILIVDDSKAILAILKSEVDKYPDIDACYAQDYKSAMRLMRDNQGEFHAALLDLNLPDAPNGEIVKLANANKIPSVVLSGTVTEKTRESFANKDIIDIIVKDTPASAKFAVNAILRTLKNYDTHVLVVDDSKIYKKSITDSLHKIKLNVIEAENGEEALLKLESNPNISMVITDYEMPKMNGLDLTFKIRELYKKDQLSIIAMSTVAGQEIIAKFLRFGANDFLNKPFSHSEIVTRVNSNLELLDLFSKIKDMANKDFLTGMFNRRYFFDSGKSIFNKNKRKRKPLAVVMVDIDKFKNINDSYGHDVGDDAIKQIKVILDKNLRESDLVARFGGEEFCILLEDINIQEVQALFEKIRAEFESNAITSHGFEISYTISTGVFFGLLDSMDEMIKLSDEALYEAKITGRNKVVIKS